MQEGRQAGSATRQLVNTTPHNGGDCVHSSLSLWQRQRQRRRRRRSVVVGILSQPLRVSETASTAEARRVCVCVCLL